MQKINILLLNIILRKIITLKKLINYSPKKDSYQFFYYYKIIYGLFIEPFPEFEENSILLSR